MEKAIRENSERKIKTIYERLDNYTKEEINDAFLRLSKEDQELLIKTFGKKLDDSSKYKELSKEEKKKIARIIYNKLKLRIIKKEIKHKDTKNIFELYQSYTKEEILDAISRLTTIDRNILKKAYGNNYDDVSEFDKLDDKEKSRIKNVVNNILKEKLSSKTRTVSVKTIFERYSTYSEQEILDAIERLNIEDKTILYKAYGKDLKENDKYSSLTKEEKDKVIIIVNAKIKSRLKNKTLKGSRIGKITNIKTPFDKFQDYTKEEILDAISRLKEKERTILKKAFGKEYNNYELYRLLNQKEKAEVKRIMIKTLPCRLKNKNLKDKTKTIYEYYPEIPREKVKEAFSKLREDERKLLIEAYGETLEDKTSYQKIDKEKKKRIRYIITRKLKVNEKNKQIKKTTKNNQQSSKKIAKNNQHSSKKRKKVKTIYEYLEEYQTKDINKAIASLTKENRELLIKAFGNNLDNIDNYLNLTKEEKSRISKIKFSLKRRLKRKINEKNNQVIKIADNTVQDILDKTDFERLSRDKEIEFIKKAKLSYYYELSEEDKKTYLEYYKDIFPIFKRRYDISNGEEREKLLLKAIKNSKYWRDRFIENNQRLVVSIAKRYSFSTPLDDLVIEGNIGLIIALKKYDMTKKTKFSTYATLWIRQTINRYIKNSEKMIRLPVHVEEKIYTINSQRESFIIKNGREPSVDEISKMTGFSKEKIMLLQKYETELSVITSLNAKIKDETDTEMENFIINDDNPYEKVDEKLFLNEMKNIINNSRLNQRTIEILFSRYGIEDGIPKTLEELSKKYNITSERIRQIEKKGLQQLRANEQLQTFYDSAEGISANNYNSKEKNKLKQIKRIIEENQNDFTHMEIYIIYMFYVENKTIKEIENILNISSKQIEEIKENFLKKNIL